MNLSRCCRPLSVGLLLFFLCSCSSEANTAVSALNRFLSSRTDGAEAPLLDPQSVSDLAAPFIRLKNQSPSGSCALISLYNDATASLAVAAALYRRIQTNPNADLTAPTDDNRQLVQALLRSLRDFHQIFRLTAFRAQPMDSSFRADIVQNSQWAHQLFQHIRAAQPHNSHPSESSEPQSQPSKPPQSEPSQSQSQPESTSPSPDSESNPDQSGTASPKSSSSNPGPDSDSENVPPPSHKPDSDSAFRSLSREDLQQLYDHYQPPSLSPSEASPSGSKPADSPAPVLPEDAPSEAEGQSPLSNETIRLFLEEQRRREERAQPIPLQGDDFHVEKDW